MYGCTVQLTPLIPPHGVSCNSVILTCLLTNVEITEGTRPHRIICMGKNVVAQKRDGGRSHEGVSQDLMDAIRFENFIYPCTD